MTSTDEEGKAGPLTPFRLWQQLDPPSDLPGASKSQEPRCVLQCLFRCSVPGLCLDQTRESEGGAFMGEMPCRSPLQKPLLLAREPNTKVLADKGSEQPMHTEPLATAVDRCDQ